MLNSFADFADVSPHRWGKRIASLLLLVLLVCGLLLLYLFRESLNIDSLRRYITYLNVRDRGTYGSYSYDSHSSNCYGAFQDGLAVASVGGLNIYNENGEELVISQQQMTSPALLIGKQLAAAYDVGGSSLIAIHSRNGEVLHLTSEKSIFDADMAEDGSLCFASAADGYKTVISVYNDTQDCVFRWFSSTTYMPVCAVSNKAKYVAAVGLGQKEGEYESTLYLFRTRSEEPELTVSLGNDWVYDLQFLNEKTLCAIGSNGVTMLNLSGQILGTYTYAGRYLKEIDTGGDGFLALTVNMYKAGNRCSLVILDETGKEISSLPINQEVLDVSACGKYVAVLTPDALTIYTQSLQIYDQTPNDHSANAVEMRKDGSALLMGSGVGSLYIP